VSETRPNTTAFLSAAAFGLLIASTAPSVALVDMCERDYNQCMDSCDRMLPGGDGSPRARCVGQCGLMFMSCLGKLKSGSTNKAGGYSTPPPKYRPVLPAPSGGAKTNPG